MKHTAVHGWSRVDFQAGCEVPAAELCQEFELHPTQINDWKRQLLERAADVFGAGTATEPVDLAPLHAKIGQLALECVFRSNPPYIPIKTHQPFQLKPTADSDSG
jgi:hypothetical protein